MSSKISALQHQSASGRNSVQRPQPTKMAALSPANIEQAANLGEGYVIVKLRHAAPDQNARAKEKIPPLPPEAEIPLMSIERLLSALHRGSKLAGITDLRKSLLDNQTFMRNLADQEQARRIQLIEDGQLIRATELATRLGMSPQAVSKAAKAGRLFALEGDSGRRWYPVFYADSSLSRRDLNIVTQALGDIPASSKWQFFTTPKASLDGITPLQALKNGALKAVLMTAAGFVER